MVFGGAQTGGLDLGGGAASGNPWWRVFKGALALCKMILLMFILGALVALAWGGPAAFVLVLFYVGAVLVLYSRVLFAIARLLACGDRAALYLSSVSL
jgi:hypothetical protein